MPRTYRESGVDVDLESRAIASLIESLEGERARPSDIIHTQFTGLIEFGDYALSLCADSTGTKIILAREMGRLDTIGIDCIAMNVNDMVCAGARPLAFVDYLAMENPDPEVAAEIGKGLARGAELSGIRIIGGETATLPEVVTGLDLAGTCLGYVRRDSIITGDHVRKGDVIIGLASSGVHSNGYTLVRKVLSGRMGDIFDDRSVGEVLLEPTAIYVRAVLELIGRIDVHGMAHITGGGFRNLTRPRRRLRYVVSEPLPVTPIFPFIQDAGGIETPEMYRTFNMGMGFAVMLDEKDAEEAVGILSKHHEAKVIGHVEAGEGVIVPDFGISLPPYA